jgi:hypothetical protein
VFPSAGSTPGWAGLTRNLKLDECLEVDVQRKSRPCPRLPSISKYCVSCRSAALESLNEYAMLTPLRGFCWTPFTKAGSGRPAASRIVRAGREESPICRLLSLEAEVKGSMAERDD